MKDIVRYSDELLDFINKLNLINYYDDNLDRNNIEDRFHIKHAFDVGPHIYMDLLILKATDELYLYFCDKRVIPLNIHVFKFFGTIEDYLKIKNSRCKHNDSLSCIDDIYTQSECFYDFMALTLNRHRVFAKKYDLK